MYKFFTIIILLLSNNILLAQNNSSSVSRFQTFEKRYEQENYLDSVLFRSVGPTIMSGRVVDIEVNPKNSNEFFVAYASGGIWHTENNGLSFQPIFDHEATHTIGDMAMNWTDNILWVGTGEVNSSRSSYAGLGIFKTYDRGKNWEHYGLEETHHIGKIILHPSDKRTAWVAALGHLYTNNKQRGIFKTTSGGRSWKKTLFINDSTGSVDLSIHPKNPNVLYAASWTRTRKAWNFTGSGEGSAIWKSTNGGEQWKKITSSANGFPQGKGVGRIGIAISASEPNIIYALLDNNFHQEKTDKEEKVKAADFLNMDAKKFNNLSKNKLNDFLRQNGYPKKYDAESVKEDIKEGNYTIADIGKWRLADADAELFETPIYGAEVYRSTDDGQHWAKMNTKLLDGVYFTYGYYFGTISVSPKNSNHVWIGGYPLLLSKNGGKTFKQKDGDNTHPDYHRVWINPNNPKHIIACNDGGINISYDEGKKWAICNTPAVGQFYTVAVDNARPYNVYGGLQDNGTWVGSSLTSENTRWQQQGQYAYKRLGGGDGMQVQVDTRNNNTVYLGYQFGNYTRRGGGKRIRIKPIHDIGETAYRFNWQTPILLSKHNQDIFYYGSNKFHRSMNKGADLQTLSKDLSTTSQKGNVPFGTMTTLSESPKKFGLLYAGTDDGTIWRSDDVGYHWEKITTGLPEGKWVTRLIASEHIESRVYAALNGYRDDDFTPYLYRSDDYGKTWQSIQNNLPFEPINVMKEDPKEVSIVYVGTDNGLYVSTDNAKNYSPWHGGLPRVAVHDIAIQKRENEIVLGTHGRSVYISSLDLVQKLNRFKDKDIAILAIADQQFSRQLGKKWASFADPYSYEVPIRFFTQNGGATVLRVLNNKMKLLYKKQFQSGKGWNMTEYNFSVQENFIRNLKNKIQPSDDNQYYLPAGDYFIEIENSKGQKKRTALKLTDKE